MPAQGDKYRYISESGTRILVSIHEDRGMVNGPDGVPWHKVTAHPIGFNNCPLMVLDFDKLEEEKEC